MVDGVPPLETEIRRLIGIAGPMPVRQFMNLCLTHPEHGYYMTRDPLGTAGDFTTSPEISQMFGELIGLWVASVWRRMGSPEQLVLVELGPGRGTLTLDAVRAARVVPGFRQALSIHLVETSPALQRRQRQTLGGLDLPITWHQALVEVPEGPTIIVANEFFDALPINQAVKKDGNWCQRVVDIDAAGNLAFAVADEPLPRFDLTLPATIREAQEGAIFEWRANDIVLDLSRRVRSGGAALIIDYGHTESAVGDTFQAVRAHTYSDPFTSPGQVDLTAHVDFDAIALNVDTMGARVHGPVGQAEFLQRMGIDTRADALKAVLNPEKAAEVEAARQRLISTAPTGMGRLFKVLAFSDQSLDMLPAFEKAAAVGDAEVESAGSI
ncbi:MAG: SAM-dependent methyltransferase [Proteobacteria bacterium]|nr:SAM-dependent methyltransferase [Pseudomonadota bacterium]